jgi:hypothetical protein
MARDGALTDAKARVLITTLFGNFFYLRRRLELAFIPLEKRTFTLTFKKNETNQD